MIEFTIPPLPALRAELVSTLKLRAADLAALLGLTIVAAIPRLALLTTIPYGFHGDEAWTGLDAQRVLDHGWIGPYVSSALGQPAGPLYFAAPFVAVFGHTIFAVRFAMAVLGIATIPTAYLAFRLMFDRALAVLAAFLLAVSVWHLHYSRIGFMVISWPLMELITLYFLFLGMKTGQRRWYAVAGLAFGAGVYTYNAYPAFIVPMGVFLIWMALRRRGPERLPFVHRAAVMLTVAFIAALPLIGFALNPQNDYLAHHRLVSVSNTPEWQVGGLSDRADILYENARHYFRDAFWSGAPDLADGAGTQAMVDHVSLGLIILGFAISLWRWRQPQRLLIVLMVLLVPFGAVVNATGGRFRQSFGIVPFVMVLAATPLALWWELAKSMGRVLRFASYLGIGVILAAIGYLNLHYYFVEFRDTGAARYTFAYEISDASLYLHNLPDHPYVYFYSGRWGINYETRLFLAGNVKGEDRSIEFSPLHKIDLTQNHAGSVVYVFLDPYLDHLNEVQRLYPGGQSFEKVGFKHKVEYRAYYLPSGHPTTSGPSATPQPTALGPTPVPTATMASTVEGQARDAKRVQDLAAIKGALAQYRQKHGEYPNNGGGIQTLCIYPEDIGCKLREILPRLPTDPLGDPGLNGYFYASDGSTYAVYAIRESTLFPPCAQHPGHLARFPSVFCATGP